MLKISYFFLGLSLPSSDEGSSDDKQEENSGWNVYRPDNSYSQVSR